MEYQQLVSSLAHILQAPNFEAEIITVYHILLALPSAPPPPSSSSPHVHFLSLPAAAAEGRRGRVEVAEPVVEGWGTERENKG